MICCPNKSCLSKGVQRLVALLKDLGIKNMGESKCRKFMQNFGITNPNVIFMYEPTDGVLYEGCSESFSMDIYKQMNTVRSMLLWEYVKVSNLPGIRDSARKLFSNYNTLEDFYDDMEEGGIAFIQSLLSIKGKEGIDDFEDESAVSVKATAVYDTLTYFKDSLLEAVEYVKIKQITTKIVNVCISTRVGEPYGSKKEFVTKLNNDFESKIHLNWLQSVSNDCEFLIWAKTGSITNKVQTVERINEKRRKKNRESGIAEDSGLIQIMTGTEFYNYVSEL
ncbi:hypothetical protein D3C71_1434740 [compost metagenome]